MWDKKKGNVHSLSMNSTQVSKNAEDIHCISIKIDLYASLLFKLLYILKKEAEEREGTDWELLLSFKHRLF